MAGAAACAREVSALPWCVGGEPTDGPGVPAVFTLPPEALGAEPEDAIREQKSGLVHVLPERGRREREDGEAVLAVCGLPAPGQGSTCDEGRMRDQRAYNRVRYAKRRDSGACVDECGAKADPGSVRCTPCRAIRAEAVRRHRGKAEPVVTPTSVHYLPRPPRYVLVHEPGYGQREMVVVWP